MTWQRTLRAPGGVVKALVHGLVPASLVEVVAADGRTAELALGRAVPALALWRPPIPVVLWAPKVGLRGAVVALLRRAIVALLGRSVVVLLRWAIVVAVLGRAVAALRLLIRVVGVAVLRHTPCLSPLRAWRTAWALPEQDTVQLTCTLQSVQDNHQLPAGAPMECRRLPGSSWQAAGAKGYDVPGPHHLTCRGARQRPGSIPSPLAGAGRGWQSRRCSSVVSEGRRACPVAAAALMLL